MQEKKKKKKRKGACEGEKFQGNEGLCQISEISRHSVVSHVRIANNKQVVAPFTLTTEKVAECLLSLFGLSR
jgi:hypothetical protein